MNTFRKISFVFFCFLISNAGLKAQTKNIISPSNKYIQYMGRVDFSNPEKPLFAYPNVTIKAKFEGTSIDLLIKHYNGNYTSNYFVSIIDGGAPVKFQVTSAQQTYSIASNLSTGQHTVEIIKVTESDCGECEFLGFQIDNGASLLAPDPLPNLKIEFFGNSITCGYGIEGGARPSFDNSYKAYAAVAARQLNAQIHTTSYSGIGVVNGYPPFLMKDMYNRTIAITSYYPFPTNNTWDFTRFIPDVVIVALGTNDYSKGFNAVTFKPGYTDLIAQIRIAYPNSFIICTNSPMVSNSTLGASINEVVANLKTAGDNKIHYFSFTSMIGGGYNGHPCVADGQTHGKQLADFIKTILPPTSISQVIENKADFTVFPNPTKKFLSVKSAVNADFIEISDLSGKIVEKIKVSLPGEVYIDISHIVKGTYLFSTINGNDLKVTRKVCKL